MRRYQTNEPYYYGYSDLTIYYKWSCNLNVITPPPDKTVQYTLGLSQGYAPGKFTSSYSACTTYTYSCTDDTGIACMSPSSKVYPFLTSFSVTTGVSVVRFSTYSVASFNLKIIATNFND